MSKVLTVEQAAALLQVTPRTVYEWLKRRRIPGRKVGKVWLIPEDALLEYLRGDTATAGKE